MLLYKQTYKLDFVLFVADTILKLIFGVVQILGVVVLALGDVCESLI
jgi:hypothetical protein